MTDTVTLATMGPAGTHSEAAARVFALRQGLSARLVFGPVEQCLRLVAECRADLAVLPAENMVDGLIGTTFDALIESCGEIQVLDELHLSIEHALAVHTPQPLDEILRVYSHPSALNQCLHRLSALVPSAALIPVGSTAEAATRVASGQEGRSAALCSVEAAAAHGLLVLAERLGDYPMNETRFFACGHGDAPRTGDDRTLIAVRYGRNQPGQLYRTAGAFAKREVDLTSVHSRPYKIRPQEYVLLFELVGHRADRRTAEALAEIEDQVAETDGWLLVLGSFPRRSRVDGHGE